MAQVQTSASVPFEVLVLSNYNAASANVTRSGFVAQRNYNIIGAGVRLHVASSSGTVNLTIDAAAGAAGSGGATSILTGVMSTSTPVADTTTPGTVTAAAQIVAGQSIGVTMAGTITGLADLQVYVTLQPA